MLATAKQGKTRARQRATKRDTSRTSSLTSMATLLTKTQLAARWQVSTRTVERLLASGLPSLVIGGHHRFDPVEAEEWLRKRGE